MTQNRLGRKTTPKNLRQTNVLGLLASLTPNRNPQKDRAIPSGHLQKVPESKQSLVGSVGWFGPLESLVVITNVTA